MCWGPCPCDIISFSCATILDSSSTARAKGRPTKRADVVTTQPSLPSKRLPVKAYDVVVLKEDEMDRRVDGGMMSFSAAIRSQTVSSFKARPRSETSDSSETSDCEKVGGLRQHMAQE